MQETTNSLNDDEAALDLRVMVQQQEVERMRVKLSISAKWKGEAGRIGWRAATLALADKMTSRSRRMVQ